MRKSVYIFFHIFTNNLYDFIFLIFIVLCFLACVYLARVLYLARACLHLA